MDNDSVLGGVRCDLDPSWCHCYGIWRWGLRGGGGGAVQDTPWAGQGVRAVRHLESEEPLPGLGPLPWAPRLSDSLP